MVLVRKRFFRSKFEHIINSQMARDDPEGTLRRRNNMRHWGGRFRDRLRHRSHPEPENASSNGFGSAKNKGQVNEKLRPDMIRRVHGAPRHVNPMGWISEQEPAEIEMTAAGSGAVFAPEVTEDTVSDAGGPVPDKAEISTPQSSTTS